MKFKHDGRHIDIWVLLALAMGVVLLVWALSSCAGKAR